MDELSAARFCVSMVIWGCSRKYAQKYWRFNVKISFISLALLLAVLSGSSTAIAAPPQTMNFQGYLKSTEGVPYTGTKKLTFRIYNAVTGDSALWTEIQPTVNISKGQFSVTLGAGTPAVPLALAFDKPYWLGVTVDPEATEMAPRQPLTSVPYAMHSSVASVADTIAEICAPGEILEKAATGWICSSRSAVACSAGDFLSCYNAPVATMGVGPCKAGIRVCSGGSFGACSGAVLPSVELCDGLDNDCNGQVDETFNLQTDLLNCGQCGNSCAAKAWPHVALYSCSAGQCGIGACSSGYVNENETLTDGCEILCSNAVDIPDSSHIDSNCDGIDGDIAESFFVSKTGDDSRNPGTMATPFLTIQKGIDAAAASSVKKNVLVSRGTYNEAVTLKAGVSIFGQYDAARGWTRVPAPIDGNETIISSPTTVGLIAANYTNPTTGYIDSFTIIAADARSPVYSSRAMILDAVTGSLVVRNNKIVAGNGTSGTNGAAGANGVAGSPGGAGGAGSKNSSAGGLGGDGGTSNGWLGIGGVGGRGGYNSSGEYGNAGIYTHCGDPMFGWGGSFCGNKGENGASAAKCSNGDTGGDGSGGISNGMMSGYDWSASAGAKGLLGGDGSGGDGGGGGGGGYGNDTACFADRGGGGGGGGGAGTGGSGGGGGGGGGGSIPLIVMNSSGVTVSDNSFISSSGGAGGAGAAGGTGGAGAAGGPGGAGADESGNGGAGGWGSNGGNGGHGGGGAGGASIGIFLSGSTITQRNNSFTLGTAGSGGSPNGLAGIKVNILTYQ